MAKTLYTLNVDDYAPAITALTYPLLRHYAERCRAEFYVIRERKLPSHYPAAMEKLQIFDLARRRDDEWSVFVDSDALIHPECIDFTCFLPKDTVLHHGVDPAPLRWRYDEVFLRDGRNVGSCNWFTVASHWCRDLWAPLDLPLAGALANIRPTQQEARSGVIDAAHLLDDYTLSRNIARFGLKVQTAPDVYKRVGIEGPEFFFHVYDLPLAEKVAKLRETLDRWDLKGI